MLVVFSYESGDPTTGGAEGGEDAGHPVIELIKSPNYKISETIEHQRSPLQQV